MSKFTRASVPIVIAVCLAACGTSPKTVNPNDTPEKLYASAKDQLVGGAYDLAIKEFEQLEARFPYGRYAQQAQLEIAYAYFLQRDSASSIAACERFIKLHPNHPSVDYAYYIKGLALINEDRSWATWINTPDLSQRDPKVLQESFDTFKELTTRYPESRYAADAAKRMRILVAALAKHELNVAKYYLSRRSPLAAANRAQALVKTYPDSPAVEEALSIMVDAYGELNLPDLQNDAKRVLQLNYPQSTYLKTR